MPARTAAWACHPAIRSNTLDTHLTRRATALTLRVERGYVRNGDYSLGRRRSAKENAQVDGVGEGAGAQGTSGTGGSAGGWYSGTMD